MSNSAQTQVSLLSLKAANKADLQSNGPLELHAVDSLDWRIAKQDKQIQDMQRQLQQCMFNWVRVSDSGIAPFDAASEYRHTIDSRSLGLFLPS